MGYINCPKCNSTNCTLETKGMHFGILFFILFSIFWLLYAICKWTIGLFILICFDWWIAIIMKRKNKTYYWHCKKWFIKRNGYYCNDCNYHFKA